MRRTTNDELLAKYASKLRELFSGPLGEEVLEMMVDIHVMVPNNELDPVIEGERSFVLDLKEIVEAEPETEEAETDE